MNGVLNLGWWVALGGIKFGGVFVLNYGYGGGKMKCAMKKMVGDKGLAGRLIAIFDHCSGMGPTKSKKIWVMKSWKYVPNGWNQEIWVFWVMSDENWVISDEWHFF